MDDFTRRSDGVISQTNFAGARLLNVERARLVSKRFEIFLLRADRRGPNAYIPAISLSQ